MSDQDRLTLAELRECVTAAKNVFRTDPYAAGAAFMFDKNITRVTPEEREKFKIAFFYAYNVLGPTLITNVFECAEQAYGVGGAYGPGGERYTGPDADWYREQAAQEKHGG